jgi:hypothetical protein
MASPCCRPPTAVWEVWSAVVEDTGRHCLWSRCRETERSCDAADYPSAAR